MNPHAFLNAHDVRHETFGSKIGSTGDHQHHPISLQQQNPFSRIVSTFSKDRVESRQNKDFPVRLNPSFMSHQHHPILKDNTLPIIANQSYPKNHPLFYNPRSIFQKHNQSQHHHRQRRTTVNEEYEYSYPPEPQTTRTEDGDMIYMAVSFVLLGATLLLTLLILILPGFSKGSPHLPILVWMTHILVSVGLRSDEAALPLRLGLGWVLLEIFLIWVTVPLRFRAALAYNALITILHTAVVFWRGRVGEAQPFLGAQVCSYHYSPYKHIFLSKYWI